MRTTSQVNGRRARIAGLATAAAGIGLVVTACAGPAGGTAAGNSAAPSSHSGGTQSVTVETHSGPMGTFLTDGNGKTLYLFAHDKGHTSTCNGACAHFWPPLTTKSSPKGAGQVQNGALATSKRNDGTTQVTYHGHPLYYFLEDQSAGDTKGQGLNQDGGLWWLVTPRGTALTKTGPTTQNSGPTTQNSPSTGGGGAGGWA